jgi:DNA polymerase-3 subunit epsilon
MREKHGALLDSEILADVYLELIGGKQPDFALDQGKSTEPGGGQTWRPAPRPGRLPVRG